MEQGRSPLTSVKEKMAPHRLDATFSGPRLPTSLSCGAKSRSLSPGFKLRTRSRIGPNNISLPRSSFLSLGLLVKFNVGAALVAALVT